MEKYDNLGMVGEGSYGMVMKCKHKETGQIVAVKKFLESEDDKMVKKIAMREVRMLRKLRHENLVNLIEVFRRRKRLYLVFEFVDHTVLDDLEKYPNGLSEMTVRKILWQVLRGVEFCHSHNIIHRDIKPENILNSRTGVIKLCDFGFARTLAAPGEVYTDYVATRWYRAPELLVGDTKYGRAVDIWAVGCLITEMLTGDPLFPGDSDIDQLYHIIKCFGNLCPRHREIFQRNPLFAGMRLPDVRDVEPLEKRFPKFSSEVLDLMKQCLRLDPNDRPSSSLLLRHEFFKKDGFEEKVVPELRARIQKDNANNILARKEANEKKEQEKRKKKKEMTGNAPVDAKDAANIPSPKKSSDNKIGGGSPNKSDSSSMKKDNLNKLANKTPTTTPPREAKRRNTESDKSSSKVNTPKQLPSFDQTRQAVKSDKEARSSDKEARKSDKSVLPKSVVGTPIDSKNSMPQIQKKRAVVESSQNSGLASSGSHATPNGILKTPPSKRATAKEDAAVTDSLEKLDKSRDSRRKSVKTPRELVASKNSTSDTFVAKDRQGLERSLVMTAPTAADEKQLRVGATKASSKHADNEIAQISSIPRIQAQQSSSKTSTPDPLLMASAAASTSTPLGMASKHATMGFGGPQGLRGIEKQKKGIVGSVWKNENPAQVSFDRNMYPDKTSHFEKMMMTMSGATAITHPAIKKSNAPNVGQQEDNRKFVPSSKQRPSNLQVSFKSNQDKSPGLSLWSPGNAEGLYHHTTSLDTSSRSNEAKHKATEDKKLREKSPKRGKKEPKMTLPGNDEKAQRDLKPDSKPMRLPNIGQKMQIMQDRDSYLPDLAASTDATHKQKKPKAKLMLAAIPTLHDHSSSSMKTHHKSRTPSPTSIQALSDSNFPSVRFKN